MQSDDLTIFHKGSFFTITESIDSCALTANKPGQLSMAMDKEKRCNARVVSQLRLGNYFEKTRFWSCQF